MEKTIALLLACTLLSPALTGCGPSVTVEQVPPPDAAELASAPLEVPRMRDPEIVGELGHDGDASDDAPGPCNPACDDGNPCTVNECQGGACVYPDDTEFPACNDGAAVCVAGECCAAPRCFDKGACVDACSSGATCGADGTCD